MSLCTCWTRYIWVRRVWKMLEKVDAGNYKVMNKISEEIYALMYSLVSYHCPQQRSILARPTRDGRLRKLIPLSPGWIGGLRLQDYELALWKIELSSSIHHGSSVGEARHWCEVLIAFGPWTLLEEEFMAYRLCNSPKMEPLRMVLQSLKAGNAAEISWLVCRISSIK